MMCDQTPKLYKKLKDVSSVQQYQFQSFQSFQSLLAGRDCPMKVILDNTVQSFPCLNELD